MVKFKKEKNKTKVHYGRLAVFPLIHPLPPPKKLIKVNQTPMMLCFQKNKKMVTAF